MSDLPEGQRFEALNQALDELLSLTPEERSARLASWHRDRPEEARWLERLLAAAEPRRDGVDDVLGRAVARSIAATTPMNGATLGAWRLSRMLGRGGMAEVWLATGSGTHNNQTAAIKILAAERASVELVARFEQERRILATLDDPRIARLLDAGVGEDGRPWLAMECVDGERIDHWCDAQRLDIGARIRLLREVAMAVHSAHRRLIVHRDIKPANVMITGDGHVKLLDFGIAKLLNPEHEDAGEAPTLTHARVLTPQYASPEQFLGEPATTAVDVYQLGVLMMQLLTGARPFQSSSSNLVELAHAVVSEDPPGPSQVWARAGYSANEADAVLQARNTTAARLRRQLRGDLDAIAQRALARLPSQRYASAQQLADDLDAWLTQRPVRARPPSLGYHLQRFISRNWFGSAVAIMLAVVIVAYVATVMVQSERIRRQAELNQLVRNYLVELLREADPRFTRAPRANADTIIEDGLARARSLFTAQPDLLAELLGIGGDVLIGRGNYARGAELVGESLLLRRSLDPDDPTLTDVLARYGRALHYIARYADSEAALIEAERRWYAQGADGSAWIPLSLADVLHSRGDYVRAESVLRRADAAQSLDNTPVALRAELGRELGSVLRDSGRLTEARAIQMQAFEDMKRLLGEKHGSTLATQAALAQTLVLAGDVRDARIVATSVLEAQIDIYGAHHAVVGICRNTLALADELDGDFESAERRLDDILFRDYASIVPGNVLLAYAHLDRAWVRVALGRYQGAASDLDAAEPALSRIRDGGHPRWSSVLLARAVLAARNGNPDHARQEIGLAIAQRESLFGPEHPGTIEARRWLKALNSGVAPVPSDDASALDRYRIRWLLAGPQA